jgi:membrane protein implicated in regulation of membrane protease activity
VTEPGRSLAELRRSLRIVRALQVVLLVLSVICLVALTAVGDEVAWSLVMIVFAVLSSINIVFISNRLKRLESAGRPR